MNICAILTYKGCRLTQSSCITAWSAISNVATRMSAASNVNYWSSSEWSGAGYAFNVNFNSNGNLNFERNNAKSNAFRVRPVLAYRLERSW